MRAREFGTLEKASIFLLLLLSGAAAKWNERSERMAGMKDELPLTDSPSCEDNMEDVQKGESKIEGSCNEASQNFRSLFVCLMKNCMWTACMGDLSLSAMHHACQRSRETEEKTSKLEEVNCK